MKKILIVMSIALTSFFTHAQQIRLEETPLNWPLMLSNLNQSDIKAGFLYNKSAMFTNLNNFNIGNYNTSYVDHFSQAINELHYAADQNLFISANQLKSNIASTALNSVDIGLINTEISTLNFDEKNPSSAGLTFLVNRFVPIAGKPSFLNRKILVASPLKEMLSGTAVTYNFSDRMIFNTVTSAIKNMVVYFNDNVPVTVIDKGVLVLRSKTISY